MRLILARHGNTFGPGDTPVWVGAREDLPLTEQGEAQSRAFGDALREAGLTPSRVLAGPLRRTRRGAELAAEACGFSGRIEIDDRLKEIDYGAWGGRSDADIAAEWGEAAIDAWRERSEVPEGAGWSPSPETIAANAAAVLTGIEAVAGADDLVLVISSNGILRYFHPLIGAAGDPKMKTGRWSFAVCGPAGRRALAWNAAPEQDPPAGFAA